MSRQPLPDVCAGVGRLRTGPPLLVRVIRSSIPQPEERCAAMVPEPRPAGHELTTAWVDAHGRLSIDVGHPRPRTVFVRARGEIDLSTARRLDEVLQSQVDGAVDEVVVDLGGVTFFSVAGLNSLMRAQLLADAAGARLTIDAEHSRAVRRLFALLPAESLASAR